MSTLRCHVCGLPWGRLQDGVLIIESKHHGEKHTNTVVVEKLVKLCQEGSTPDAECEYVSERVAGRVPV